MSRQEELALRLSAVQDKIATLVHEAGREPGSVKLLPVTKFHTLDDVKILHSLGIRAVGENREQEAKDKQSAFPGMDFHMIGQIQTKKANSVARWAAAVHSVDSARIADALDRGVQLALDRGDRKNDRQGFLLPCFIQLSLDGNPSRGGVPLEQVNQVVDAVESASNLEFNGLMCVPPLGWEPSRAFAQAKGVLSGLEERFDRSLEFSAGMSGDLAEAINHGSTFVRVGTEILGKRPLA